MHVCELCVHLIRCRHVSPCMAALMLHRKPPSYTHKCRTETLLMMQFATENLQGDISRCFGFMHHVAVRLARADSRPVVDGIPTVTK